MKEIKVTRKEKLVIEEIAVFLGIIILVFLAINFYSRLSLVSPSNEEVLIDRNPEFSWSGKYNEYELLVDDSINFDSPILKVVDLKGNSYKANKEFGFGKYYWKIKAFDGEEWIESKSGSFKVESVVALRFEEEGVRNVGNTEAKVDILEKDEAGWSVVGAAVLDVRELLSEDGEERVYKAEQNE